MKCSSAQWNNRSSGQPSVASRRPGRVRDLASSPRAVGSSVCSGCIALAHGESSSCTKQPPAAVCWRRKAVRSVRDRADCICGHEDIRAAGSFT